MLPGYPGEIRKNEMLKNRRGKGEGNIPFCVTKNCGLITSLKLKAAICSVLAAVGKPCVRYLLRRMNLNALFHRFITQAACYQFGTLE